MITPIHYLLKMSVDIEATKESEEFVSCLPSYPLDNHDFKESCFRMKNSLNVSDQERKRIDMETRRHGAKYF